MSRAHHCGLTSLFVLKMNPFIVLSMLMFDGISGRPVSAGNTPGGRRCGMGWLISLHHDCDFVFGQAVKFIDQRVNLRVGGGDLAFERGLLLRRFGGGQTLVQRQHLLDEFHHLVVT